MAIKFSAFREILCLCLISPRLLLGSYGVQNEFVHYGKSYRFESGTESSEGRYQHNSFPHLQDDGQRLPADQPNDGPQAYFCQAPGLLSYSVPQQRRSSLPGSDNFRLEHTFGENSASYVGLSPVEREALDKIEKYMMEDTSGLPLVPPTHLSCVVDHDVAPVSDICDLINPPSRLGCTGELQELNTGHDSSTQTLGTLIGSSFIAGVDPTTPDNEWNVSLPAEGSTVVPGRIYALDPRPVLQSGNEELENGKTLKRKANVEDTAMTNYGAHKADGTSYRGHVAIGGYETTPASSRNTLMAKLSDHAALLVVDLKHANKKRKIMVEKTVQHWLPVYRAPFMAPLEGPEMMAKLACLFEQLWLRNTWLLYSFDKKNDDILHRRQDEMMGWVMCQMLEGEGSLQACGFPNQTRHIADSKCSPFQKQIFRFLSSPRQSGTILVDKTGYCIEVNMEEALACKLAIYILDVYYKVTNFGKWKVVFGADDGIFDRIRKFTTLSIFDNRKRWSKNLIPRFFKEPWADNCHLQHGANILKGDSFPGYSKICKKRLEELNSISQDLKSDQETRKIQIQSPSSYYYIAWVKSKDEKFETDESKNSLRIMWDQIFNASTQTKFPEWGTKDMLHKIVKDVWYMNTWLLFSFEAETLNKHELYHWEKRNMLHWLMQHLLQDVQKETESFSLQHYSDVNHSNFEQVKKLISEFVTAPKPHIENFIKKRGRLYKVPSEQAKACELAISILKIYYKTTNPEKWNQLFPNDDLFCERFKRFFGERGNFSHKRWVKNKKWNYGINFLPWIPNQKFESPVHAAFQGDMYPNKSS